MVLGYGFSLLLAQYVHMISSVCLFIYPTYVCMCMRCTWGVCTFVGDVYAHVCQHVTFSDMCRCELSVCIWVSVCTCMYTFLDACICVPGCVYCCMYLGVHTHVYWCVYLVYV